MATLIRELEFEKFYKVLNLRGYILMEFCLFAIFFALLLKTNMAKKLIIFSIFPFFVFSVFNYYQHNWSSFDTVVPIVEFSFFIIVILYYFFEKMSVVNAEPISRSISFWICVGLFIYFTGNFFYYIYISLEHDQKAATEMRTIYSIVSISKDIILAFAWFANEDRLLQTTELQFPSSLDLDEDLDHLLPKTVIS